MEAVFTDDFVASLRPGALVIGSSLFVVVAVISGTGPDGFRRRQEITFTNSYVGKWRNSIRHERCLAAG